MIKALIRKEFRENLKVAVLGLLGFTLLALWTYRSYALLMDRAARGLARLNATSEILQPLLSSDFLRPTAWLCGIFGAALGWMQINHERNRDLWAFLMHRPVTRTKIFLGKLAAGLALYLLAAGLPLAGFVIWDATAGHVAAPFEWRMALPAFNLVLAGTAFYFAGMLTGLRQARWYASRIFGMGLAVAAAIIAFATFENMNPEPPVWFWSAMEALCAGILAVAAWGSFLSHGHYRGQPAMGKLALGVTVFVSSLFVFGFAFGFISDLLRPVGGSNSWSSYAVARDGTIYRQVNHPNYGGMGYFLANGNYVNAEPTEFFGLDGKPVISEKTGRPLTQQEFYLQRADGGGMRVDFGGKVVSGYNQYARFFATMRNSADTLWYYWRKSGRIVGYDIRSRRPVGSLGPNGFVPDLSGGGDRFVENYAFGGRSDNPWWVLQTATAAYQADLDQRTINTIFTTTSDEPIGGTAAIGRTNVLVVTRHFVHVLTAEGGELLKAPYQPAYPDYGFVRVSVLQPAGHFQLWFDPTVSEERKKQLGLQTHVVWLAEDGTVTKTAELPDLTNAFQSKPELMDKLSNLLIPFPLKVIFDHGPKERGNMVLSLLGTLAAMGTGWWLGGRYGLGRRAQIGWAVFHLCFSVIGCLTFLFLQEWAAREQCPNCRKLRVVDRERCGHCGAEFAPVPKTGTEIFEPLVGN